MHTTFNKMSHMAATNLWDHHELLICSSLVRNGPICTPIIVKCSIDSNVGEGIWDFVQPLDGTPLWMFEAHTTSHLEILSMKSSLIKFHILGF